jgi:hypothetical protein
MRETLVIWVVLKTDALQLCLLRGLLSMASNMTTFHHISLWEHREFRDWNKKVQELEVPCIITDVIRLEILPQR